MIKILGDKSVYSVRTDAWCSAMASFIKACRWCVDSVVYWLELKCGAIQF